MVEPAFAVSCPAVLPFAELASWPCCEALEPLTSELVEVEVEGVAVVSVVEGDVVEVAPALPLTEPLCAAEPDVPAGCVHGWLLVLPVALPVVPPI